MSELTIKGESFSRRNQRMMKSVTAIEMARTAKPFLVSDVGEASSTLAGQVKDKKVNADEAILFMSEKSLRFPSRVPGNRTPAPVSSNALTSWLDKGTAAHTIAPKNAGALHWIGDSMGAGGHVFTRKAVSHPGTKGKNFWKITSDMMSAISKYAIAKMKEAFAK